MPEIETGNFAIPRWILCPPDFIRVVNWNIDRGTHLSRVIEFLAGANADLVLLQETDLNARRTHRMNVAREIAHKLKLNYVFGREFQELSQGTRSSPAYHGQATLSRWPLSKPRIIRFQKQSNFWNPHWFLPQIAPFQERIGGRLALVTDACIAGKEIVTYNLHLESKGDDDLRCSQLNEVFRDSRRYAPNIPILVAGDFNCDVSRGPAANAITHAQFQNAFANQHVSTTTHSFLEQGRAIDWILVRGAVDLRSSQVYRSVYGSDHYPLSIRLTFT